MNIKSKITKRTLKALEKIIGGELTLGKLLAAIRQIDEITQVEFAKLLGVSKQYLCDVEHDRKSVSPKTAADYAHKLGYCEEQFVRLCLQGMVDRAGLNLLIETSPKSRPRKRLKEQFA